jgi:hypothetical protein
MPLRVEIPKGRAFWYIRGTVHAGKRSRPVYESTGIGAGDPRGRYKAEKIKDGASPSSSRKSSPTHSNGSPSPKRRLTTARSGNESA